MKYFLCYYIKKAQNELSPFITLQDDERHHNVHNPDTSFQRRQELGLIQIHQVVRNNDQSVHRSPQPLLN